MSSAAHKANLPGTRAVTLWVAPLDAAVAHGALAGLHGVFVLQHGAPPLVAH